MSSITFYPFHWFEDKAWKSVQVFGRLEDGKSIYVRVGFRPYFTIRYSDNVDGADIDDFNLFIDDETPILSNDKIQDNIYRYYVKDKNDYYEAIKFFKDNEEVDILDRYQNIKSKFFSKYQIHPGTWVNATDLKTLSYTITHNSKYTSADLEFYTFNIKSVEYNGKIPKMIVGYWDIETIPHDDLSFPDAELDQPPDVIFAISLILTLPNQTLNIVYLLTDANVSTNYKTNPQRSNGIVYDVTIIKVSTEKEILERFYNDLVKYKPDRLLTMNGRRFDINYIGARSRLLKIKVPKISKLLTYDPYFQRKRMVQRRPFPLDEEVWTLDTPGVSQIDILDFYRRIYPQLGNHRLETIGRIILKRGKTGLDTYAMFDKYRKSTVEDLEEIVDYSVVDSILLKELYEVSRMEDYLYEMANFWRNESDHIIVTEMEYLFEDLMRYSGSIKPKEKYTVGRPLLTERKSGIHNNVFLYDLSATYIESLKNTEDPLAIQIADYFKNTSYGIIPFKSGYFPVKFSDVKQNINNNVSTENIIWIEEQFLAATSNNPGSNNPYPMYKLTDVLPLVIVSQKSWILLNQDGVEFRKGLSGFVRPPFKLVDKYVQQLIEFAKNNPGKKPEFTNIQPTLDDYVIQSKITSDNFIMTPSRKEDVVNQLKELGQNIKTTWRKVKYIKTTEGDVIEEIYQKDPEKYAKLLNLKYYNDALRRILKTVIDNFSIMKK